MKNMANNPRRLSIITRMNHLLHEDAPWVYSFHPKSYALGHAWLKNRKPSDVGHNNLKYQRLDVAQREQKRLAWNDPVLWPLVIGAILLVLVLAPAIRSYRQRERSVARS